MLRRKRAWQAWSHSSAAASSRLYIYIYIDKGAMNVHERTSDDVDEAWCTGKGGQEKAFWLCCTAMCNVDRLELLIELVKVVCEASQLQRAHAR